MLVFQNLLRRLPKFNPLTIAKYIFLLIPFVVIMFISFFIGKINLKALLQDPMTIVWFIILMTFPFCYLLTSKIEKGRESKNLISGLAIISFVYGNIICAALLGMHGFKSYGKGMFSLEKVNMKKYKVEYGLLAFLFLVGLLTTIVRVRLNW